MEQLDIPILRKAYELYRTFHSLRSIIPKADRYTIWQRTENLILDLLEGILLASQLPKAKKLPHLEKVSVKLNMLRLFLRLTKDTKVLDIKKMIQLQEIVDEIGRMLGGWMKSVKDDHGKPTPDSHSVFERERERERESFDAICEKEVPRGCNPDVRVAVVIPVVVDIETIGIEVADVNTVAVRVL